MQTKDQLDQLLQRLKGQPVGSGYFDIIVHRDHFAEFVTLVLTAGFSINDITWWEYLPTKDQKSTFGYGGPPSKYYPGWFAELCYGDDDLIAENAVAHTAADAPRIIQRVKDKVLKYPNDIILSFDTHLWLTPAFTLEVPNGWQSLI